MKRKRDTKAELPTPFVYGPADDWALSLVADMGHQVVGTDVSNGIETVAIGYYLDGVTYITSVTTKEIEEDGS